MVISEQQSVCLRAMCGCRSRCGRRCAGWTVPDTRRLINEAPTLTAHLDINTGMPIVISKPKLLFYDFQRE